MRRWLWAIPVVLFLAAALFAAPSSASPPLWAQGKSSKPPKTPSPTPTPTLTPTETATPTPTPTETVPGERWSTRQPFLSAAFSNTSVGRGAVTSATDARTQDLKLNNTYINSARWSFPVFEAADTDPTWTITDSNGTTFSMQIPDAAAPSAGTDSHMSITQPDRRTDYEMWHAYKDSAGWHAEFMVQTDLLSDGMAGGARASAVSHLHGLIRTEEVAANHIPHALAMGVDYNQLKDGPVWPAQNQDWNGGTVYKGSIPMGSMFVLPASVNIDTLGLTPEGRELAWTLQNYGAYVLLSAGTVSLYAETEVEATQLARLDALRDAWQVLRPQLQIVTNSSEMNVAGGGERLQPAPPEVVAK